MEYILLFVGCFIVDVVFTWKVAADATVDPATKEEKDQENYERGRLWAIRSLTEQGYEKTNASFESGIWDHMTQWDWGAQAVLVAYRRQHGIEEEF